MASQFSSSFSFKDTDLRMNETLYAIKRILFTLGPLWEACIGEKFLEYFYEVGYLEYMSWKKGDVELEEDDLEWLRHLTFQETEGEQDIQENP